MKKQYIAVEADVISLMAKDVITTSGEPHGYDPEEMLGKEGNYFWEWD